MRDICCARRHWRTVSLAFAALLVISGTTASVAGPSDPWLDGVKRFEPGAFAGFGQDLLPRVVLGRPRGAGALRGSTHVVSLGHGGSIVVVFRDNVVFDGPGDDLVVFENAFHSGSESGPIFTELGIVEVSADGRAWHRFPFDPDTGEGLAGRTPVYASKSNDIDPLSPAAGGDRFDIGALGLELVRFVRILDGGDELDDVGNHVVPADKGGFDLDAMAAIHSSPPAVITGSVSHGGLPASGARVRLVPSDGSRKLRRKTGDDGTFRFWPVLPAGAFRIVARIPDVGRVERDVFVSLDVLSADVDLALP